MPPTDPPTPAQLSSLATTLEDLRDRISGYVDALSASHESSAEAIELAEVERSVQAAARRLRKLTS